MNVNPRRCGVSTTRAGVLLLFAALALAPRCAAAQSLADMTAVYGRGVHAYFANQTHVADRYFSDVINAGSTDPRPYYFRAMARLRMGRRYEAEQDMQVGAMYEALDPGAAGWIGGALSRVQGPQRQLLEQHRRRAKIQYADQQRMIAQARYEQLQLREADVLRRETPMELDQLVTEGPPPAPPQTPPGTPQPEAAPLQPEAQPAAGVDAQPTLEAEQPANEDDPFGLGSPQETPGDAGAATGDAPPAEGAFVNPAAEAAAPPTDVFAPEEALTPVTPPGQVEADAFTPSGAATPVQDDPFGGAGASVPVADAEAAAPDAAAPADAGAAEPSDATPADDDSGAGDDPFAGFGSGDATDASAVDSQSGGAAADGDQANFDAPAGDAPEQTTESSTSSMGGILGRVFGRALSSLAPAAPRPADLRGLVPGTVPAPGDAGAAPPVQQFDLGPGEAAAAADGQQPVLDQGGEGDAEAVDDSADANASDAPDPFGGAANDVGTPASDQGGAVDAAAVDESAEADGQAPGEAGAEAAPADASTAPDPDDPFGGF